MPPCNSLIDSAGHSKGHELIPMKAAQHEYCYQQIHIDAARNATDDFNPFHDQKKWNRIHGNPFGMPIVLGFQVDTLIAI